MEKSVNTVNTKLKGEKRTDNMHEIRTMAERVGGGDLEALRETLKADFEKYEEFYNEAYEGITAKRKAGDSWPTLFSSVIYQDDPPSNEIMVRLVEAENKAAIKDARHFQKLTGIDPELLHELEDTLTKAREFRYMRVLNYALTKGAKYKDLLEIEPETFGLPETWTGFLRKDMDKEKAIAEALYLHSSLKPLFRWKPLLPELYGKPSIEEVRNNAKLECFGSGMNLKERADFYEAPLSLMLDAHKAYGFLRG